MKTKFLLLISSFLILISCDKTDYYPNEMVIDPEVSKTQLVSGESTTFTDYSTNVVSRSWTFNGGLPATSTDKVVNVMFAEIGLFTCTLVSKFSDGTSQSKVFKILVSPPDRGFKKKAIFSFEDAKAALTTWQSWTLEATPPATLSVDATQGANGTASSAKITFTAAGKEIQIFTNQDYTAGVNDIMDKSKRYVFSFWAKASAATTITAALENQVTVAHSAWTTEIQAWKGYLWQERQIGTTWTKYSFFINPGGQSYNVAENVYVKIKMHPNSLVDIWLDEFSLTELDGGGDGFLYRDVFSFESPTAVSTSWKSWSPESTYPATLSVDATQGANGTSSSGKVSFTATGKEIQIFTNQDYSGINAKMDKTKKYEFSFWAKASAATTITAALDNEVNDAHKAWTTEIQAWKGYLWQDRDITTTWTKYTFDIDPSTQSYAVANNVYVKIKLQPTALVDIWFDEFSLKEKP